MPSTVYRQVLKRAAEILGGKAELRACLRVSIDELTAWMDGAQLPPQHVFLSAVDIVSAQPDPSSREAVDASNDLRNRSNRIVSDARAAREKADSARARASAAMQRSGALRACLLQRRPPFAAARSNVSLHDLAEAQLARSEPQEVIEAALNVAVGSGSAVRGNIQLVAPEGLRIVGHIGFEEPFLQFFETVRHDTPSTCGPAHQRAQRVIVPQVSVDPLFAGTPAAEVMDRAGARACQSTPLLSGTGKVIGMLNTHYETPHEPSAEELQAIDVIAQRTALWLDAAA